MIFQDRLTDIVMTHMNEQLIDSVNNSNVAWNAMQRANRYRVYAEWQPPKYTSLVGWMAMNYLLFALLLSIPVIIILALTHA